MLSILQSVLVSWASAVTTVLSYVAVTPLSTRAWVATACVLPRTEAMASAITYFDIGTTLLLPVAYATILLAGFLLYGALHARSINRPLRYVLRRRLQAPLISSWLQLVSFFYPALATTILSVFSCRQLDPLSASASGVPGAVFGAPGWYWTVDMSRECFVDPGHRALALGLGIPGAAALLAYPIGQGIALAHAGAAGQLRAGSRFHADYGHLWEDFRCVV